MIQVGCNSLVVVENTFIENFNLKLNCKKNNI